MYFHIAVLSIGVVPLLLRLRFFLLPLLSPLSWLEISAVDAALVLGEEIFVKLLGEGC